METKGFKRRPKTLTKKTTKRRDALVEGDVEKERLRERERVGVPDETSTRGGEGGGGGGRRRRRRKRTTRRVDVEAEGRRSPHSRRLSCSPSAYHSVTGQDLYVEFIVAESALLRFMDVFRRSAAVRVIYRSVLTLPPLSLFLSHPVFSPSILLIRRSFLFPSPSRPH